MSTRKGVCGIYHVCGMGMANVCKLGRTRLLRSMYGYVYMYVHIDWYVGNFRNRRGVSIHKGML